MILRRNFDLSVYLVIDPNVCAGRAVEDVTRAALDGGVSMVQLRNKDGDLALVEAQARRVHDVLRGSGVAFILNDHVELAAKLGVDGVHIGQDDMSPMLARRMIGADKILGLTAYTREHYAAIDANIIDYVGTGPYFATKTKPDKDVLGGGGFRDLVCGACVPVVGIGGITPNNAGEVIRGGAQGVAMMRSVSEADDVAAQVRAFVKVVREELR